MRILVFAFLLAVSFTSCVPEAVIPTIGDETTEEPIILGRWQPAGFEDVVRYEFTDTKRFTIYGVGDGSFPTLEEFTTENPGLTGHDWWFEGEVVVIDLNFGNFSRLSPKFKCDNAVIQWMDENGQHHSTSYREGHDLSECD